MQGSNLGFYGFNFGENPLYSRLFNKDVMQRGQQAYQQGMEMFKPYDPNAEANKKEPEAAPQTTMSFDPQLMAEYSQLYSRVNDPSFYTKKIGGALASSYMGMDQQKLDYLSKKMRGEAVPQDMKWLSKYRSPY